MSKTYYLWETTDTVPDFGFGKTYDTKEEARERAEWVFGSLRAVRMSRSDKDGLFPSWGPYSYATEVQKLTNGRIVVFIYEGEE